MKDEDQDQLSRMDPAMPENFSNSPSSSYPIFIVPDLDWPKKIRKTNRRCWKGWAKCVEGYAAFEFV